METTKEKTIASIAREMLDNMEYKTRDNGDKFASCKEQIQWQTDIIFDAHPDHRLPSDSVYDVICETLELLQDVETESDAEERIREIEADVYTSNLSKWLADHGQNIDYLTQAIEEFGAQDGFNALSTAQYLFKQEIANAVLQGIKAYICQ